MSLQTRIKAAGAAAAAAPVDAGRRRAVKRRTKRAVMDRMGYDEVARISAYIDPALARSELRPAVEAALNVEEPTDLATPERETIIDEILDDVVGLGPLQPLIEDDTVTEIMINGCRSAFFERGGVLYPIEHAFEDDEQIRVLIDRIISPLGRRIDERSPIVNARLKTGYRVNAVIPPVAIDGPILTIRKFSDRICSLDELVGLGSLPLWYAQLLSCAVSLRQDLAVAGGTGSGKTTLLNALSCEISTGERIVTIEDFAGVGELTLFGQDWLRWKAQLGQDFAVFVQAKCVQRFRNSDALAFRVESVSQLYDVKRDRLKKITVSLPIDRVDDKMVAELQTIIEDHPGDTTLMVRLALPDRTALSLQSRTKTVDVDRRLLTELQSMDLEYHIN